MKQEGVPVANASDCKRVRTPVALLRSVFDEYPLKGYKRL